MTLIKFKSEHQTVKMGDNVDSDLLYDEFDNNDRKEFDNVTNVFIKFSACFTRFHMFDVVLKTPMDIRKAFSFRKSSSI